MAEIFTYTETQLQAWSAWVESRPAIIKELAERFPPNKLYWIKSSRHRATVYSYSEDGSLTMNVTGQYNRVLFGRRVFGIKPDDLEECDLPEAGEDLGDTAAEAGYTRGEIEQILLPQFQARHN